MKLDHFGKSGTCHIDPGIADGTLLNIERQNSPVCSNTLRQKNRVVAVTSCCVDDDIPFVDYLSEYRLGQFCRAGWEHGFCV